MRTPTLIVTGAHDVQVVPSRVRDFYADLGSSKKVLIDLACSSHNAMWGKNHHLLFQSRVEWLRKGTSERQRQRRGEDGILRPAPP
jgi:esterase/lipase